MENTRVVWEVQFSSIFPSVNCFTISNCIKRYDSNHYYTILKRDTVH